MNGMEARFSTADVHAVEGEGGRFRAFQPSAETIAPVRTFDGLGPGDQVMEPYRPTPGLPAGMRAGDVLATPFRGSGSARLRIFQPSSERIAPVRTFDGLGPGEHA